MTDVGHVRCVLQKIINSLLNAQWGGVVEAREGLEDRVLGRCEVGGEGCLVSLPSGRSRERASNAEGNPLPTRH